MTYAERLAARRAAVMALPTGALICPACLTTERDDLSFHLTGHEAVFDLCATCGRDMATRAELLREIGRAERWIGVAPVMPL